MYNDIYTVWSKYKSHNLYQTTKHTYNIQCKSFIELTMGNEEELRQEIKN